MDPKRQTTQIFVDLQVDLQATASAADLSCRASPRFFDDKMLERFVDAIVALGIRDSNFACL